MQIIAPDILAELKGLSVPLCSGGLLAGVVLWLTGWFGHRFWIVLFTTLAAGILGLLSAQTGRVQSLVGGLLLALAAGLLALALVRLLAFGAGGAAAWLAARALLPAGWDEPLLSFLVGGLAGLLLFRIWTMALTSCAGTLLIAYFGLCLADSLGKLDAAATAQEKAVLINWLCAGVAVVGWVFQFLLDRIRIRAERRRLQEAYPYPYRGRRFFDSRRGWNWRGRDVNRAA